MKASIDDFYNEEDDFDYKWNYNNQDFFQKNIWRLRWVLVDFQDSKYYGCVDLATLEIKSDAKWKELKESSHSDLENYVYDNEVEWIGDDFDHMQNYLSFIQDHIPNFMWETTEEGHNYPEYLNIQTWIAKHKELDLYAEDFEKEHDWLNVCESVGVNGKEANHIVLNYNFATAVNVVDYKEVYGENN